MKRVSSRCPLPHIADVLSKPILMAMRRLRAQRHVTGLCRDNVLGVHAHKARICTMNYTIAIVGCLSVSVRIQSLCIYAFFGLPFFFFFFLVLPKLGAFLSGSEEIVCDLPVDKLRVIFDGLLKSLLIDKYAHQTRESLYSAVLNYLELTR